VAWQLNVSKTAPLIGCYTILRDAITIVIRSLQNMRA